VFDKNIRLAYQQPMPLPLHVSFVGGSSGTWHIDRIAAVVGENLRPAERLAVFEGAEAQRAAAGSWVLRGTTSNARYTNRSEAEALGARQEALLRPQATRAALIPIRKTAAWWDLAQDERRAIFEEQSRHIAIGMEYLPAVARRLHHSRELGEPFDFLTWFEYAPEHADAFEDMVRRLRSTAEWRYVKREVDIRLSR
jgi:chlorite dismutase